MMSGKTSCTYAYHKECRMKCLSFWIVSIIGVFLLNGCETAPLFRGYRWYCRGAYGQSIRTFTYYLEHSRDRSNNKEERAAGFFYRGLAKTELGRGREAIDDYRDALLRVPDFFYASFNLGVEHVRLHEYDLALSMLRTSWASVLKAGRGELDGLLLWNRKVFPRDRAYCFYYYGMAAVMCGEVGELGKLLREAETFEFKEKKVFGAREVFRRIADGDLSLEKGREQVASWLRDSDGKKGRRMG